jgi:uncharacterized protein YecE (DUF72 family)
MSSVDFIFIRIKVINGKTLSLILGTSGWSYDEWVGPFYDRKRGKLTYYTKFFMTSEINSTFYRFPTKGLIQGLIKVAPPGFVFASKLPGKITHEKWLRLDEGVEEDTWRFLEVMRILAEKLGPILIQLRPKFNFVEHFENLEQFLEIIPKNYEWAVEFRDKSWLNYETFKLLRRHKVAYTIVDEPLLPPETHVTADFSYIRWHGHGKRLWYDYEYNKNELQEWIPKIKEVESKTKRVYGYFNNHYGANAVKNAVEFLDMLNISTIPQNEVLEKIKSYRIIKQETGIQTLESFNVNENELSVPDYLTSFTTHSRLSRAEKITDKEVKILKLDDKLVEGEIKNYTFRIDSVEKVMEHNCADWKKGINSKRLCKHLDKVFLILPQNIAKKILKNIHNDRDSWKFI